MHRNRQHTGTFRCKNHAKCANYCLQIKCFVYRTNYAQHNNCHKLNLSFKTYIMQQIWEISIYIYQGLSTNVIRLRPLRQVNVLGFGLIHCRWPQAWRFLWNDTSSTMVCSCYLKCPGWVTKILCPKHNKHIQSILIVSL